MDKLKVGIIGSTGYVGTELIRILLTHKDIELKALGSNSFKGQYINDIYPSLGLKNKFECVSSEDVINQSDFIFLALPHGVSEKYAIECLSNGKKVVDLGADFRLKSEEEYEHWYNIPFINKEIHKEAVYGLCEVFRENIKKARIVANPGCYPTSASLALMPLLDGKLIKNENIIIDSKSGLTGAGRELTLGSHFVECNENFNAYKIGNHRHLPEIEQNLTHAFKDKVTVTFTPHLIPINRGILSTMYCKKEKGVTLEDAHKKLTEYYESEYFVEVLPLGHTTSIKMVKLSNKCVISLHQDERSGLLIICSAIDNMVKGAAGQAVQNMNIMMGFDEKEGLNYISPAF